ncbi:MAG: type II toxin-antitoxin system VapC family toxin [Candidatus Binatia bacterium]
MIYFADTSALVKRYLNEVGSAYIHKLVATPDNVFYQSFLIPLEMASAFYRRQRMGELSAEELTLVLQAYAAHSHREYALIPHSEMLLNTAGTLIARHPLRALDAIQLAAAFSLRNSSPAGTPPFAFLSADDRLITVARHDHLLAENPNDHL